MQTARPHCVEAASSAGKIIEFGHPWDVAAVTLSSFRPAAPGPCPLGMRLRAFGSYTTRRVRDDVMRLEMGVEGLGAFSLTQS